MNRRDFIKGLGLGALSFALPGCGFDNCSPADRLERKPNFVFVLIDDLGWTDLSCYGSGFYETPAIDALARQGMRFTDAYAACPVCSPTRASIMTGKYPARLGITQWIGADDYPVEYRKELPLEEVTMAEALKTAGYATSFIGKWHLGGKGYYPEKQGFDINIGGYYRGQPPRYFSPYDIPTMTDGPEGEYLTDRHTDDALNFIEQNKESPFLLYLAHYAVHTPIQAKDGIIKKYESKIKGRPPSSGPEYIGLPDGFMTKRHQDDPVYAAMIESVDQSLGRICERLTELGLADNTIIVFTSDNGGLSTVRRKAPTANLPLRAGKGWLYEGGIRVPLIIKWPGKTKPGSVCCEPVTSTDFYPTVLEMAGLPRMADQHKDGISIAPLLKGAAKPSRRAIYWHYPHYHGSGSRPSGAVRSGDYKLIQWYETDSVELYNLREDIGEKSDLSRKMPEKAEKLVKMLALWRKSVNATVPKLDPQYKIK